MEESRQMKDKDLKEVQALIDIGKKRGYVTYEEVHNALPMHLISSDDIDDVMIMFSEKDINVVKQAHKQADIEARGATQPPEEKKLAELALTGRSNDPVRMYLRKMGSVHLLSKDGEIDIAQRIEEGESLVRRITMTSPLSMAIVEQMVKDEEERLNKLLKAGKRPRKNRSALGQTIDETYEALKELHSRRRQLFRDSRNEDGEETCDISSALQELDQQILSLMDSLELDRKYIQEIAQKNPPCLVPRPPMRAGD